VIYFFASGLAFFVGLAFAILAAGLSALPRPEPLRRAAVVAAFPAVALVLLSAVPLPGWAYGIWLLAALGWLAAAILRKRAGEKWLRAAAAAVVLASLALGLAELPHMRSPSLPAGTFDKVIVVGDSISAGMGREDAFVWPVLLSRERGVEVLNLSEAGSTAHYALRSADRISGKDSLVIIELGGNDMFARVPLPEFRRDLERLIVASRERCAGVVMFELPLPPLANAYGRVQRRLAADHGVGLIPRTVLAGVVAADGATMDGLHLTERGHRLMAGEVWRIVGGAMRQRAPATAAPPAPCRTYLSRIGASWT
jgi:acyl-CoA thioesterase-1